MPQSIDGFADPIRTDEDHAVWREYLRVVGPGKNNQLWKFPSYCDAVKILSPREGTIPSLSEINSWLQRVNWKAIYYSGFVPATEYASLQARRIFPIARHIRKLVHFSHSSAPDFIHDVFGHLPMLFEKQYGSLINDWAHERAHAASVTDDIEVAAAQNTLISATDQVVRDEAAIAELTIVLKHAQARACNAASRAGRLERFYTWALEYGLIGDGRANLKIVGAAILSSLGETDRVTTGQVRFSRFQSNVLDKPVNYTVYQDEMFEAPSFAKLHSILKAI